MKDILKWYDMLAFPIDWKQEVVKAAEHFEPGIKPVTAMENLLGALHACEKLEKIYEQKGIEKNILIDTLSDLVIWAKNCYLVTGEIGITEQAWIDSHLRGELFRLGRLQFRFGKLAEENHRLLSSCGDPVIEVHIPQGDARWIGTNAGSHSDRPFLFLIHIFLHIAIHILPVNRGFWIFS